MFNESSSPIHITRPQYGITDTEPWPVQLLFQYQGERDGTHAIDSSLLNEAVAEVAPASGNTIPMCRASFIHPAVI